eukprot:CAMPEP_0203896170 /NCGR_PEP_ID=MMETSP0359-20131031/38927_1 /ASSEMBLY_ACC=CAM_ASM_000338 /TAXON_ID=268821 /ORGANISM="Scrippsiella Hangoei, Strain SHTV-5" /LENGTH=78 /DNA_ID=CAMNT_0050818783 /DNA_START=156 /DNA_END=392 /DNA_ORIENTATION=-
MRKAGAQMTVHELDTIGEPRNGPVQQELEKLTGVITVPQVFIDGKYFGNASSVDDLVSLGTLESTFKGAGGQLAGLAD